MMTNEMMVYNMFCCLQYTTHYTLHIWLLHWHQLSWVHTLFRDEETKSPLLPPFTALCIHGQKVCSPNRPQQQHHWYILNSHSIQYFSNLQSPWWWSIGTNYLGWSARKDLDDNRFSTTITPEYWAVGIKYQPTNCQNSTTRDVDNLPPSTQQTLFNVQQSSFWCFLCTATKIRVHERSSHPSKSRFTLSPPNLRAVERRMHERRLCTIAPIHNFLNWMSSCGYHFSRKTSRVRCAIATKIYSLFSVVKRNHAPWPN